MNRGSKLDSRADSEEPNRASMRPRFMNRGSSEYFRFAIRCPPMRGFNEAPIHESGK